MAWLYTFFLTQESESSMVLRDHPEFDPFEVERQEVQKPKRLSHQSGAFTRLSPWRRSCQPHSFPTQIQPITVIRENKARQELSLNRRKALEERRNT
jgi:hypothetical protein